MPSFEQRYNKWSVRFRGYENNTEKNMRLSGFKTKREARIAYEEWVAKHPFVKIDKSVTPVESFQELAREFLESKRHDVAESTLIDTESRIRNHILPFFGNKQPDEITVADVEKWQEQLADKGLSYTTRKNARSYLNQIFDLADRRYNIANPVQKAKGLRNTDKKKEEMQVWSEKEFAQFLSVADEPMYRALFHLMYAIGCRRGEALALTKQDVGVAKQDFGEGKQDCNDGKQYIRINKSLTFKTTKDGATWCVKDTKTEYSDRYVWAPQSLIDELKALPDNDYLFGENGRPLYETTVARKFAKWTKWSKVKKIKLHDLRHSHASLLISKGVPITAVSKRLGHSKVSITLDTYAHMMPSDEDRVKKAVESL